MNRKILALSLSAFLYSGYSVDAASPENAVSPDAVTPFTIAIPPNCPSDDGAVVTLPAGKGATVFGARPRDDVVLVAIQYDRGQGQGWQWDGNPYELWDPRGPENNPAVKPYPLHTPGAFDAVQNNGTLKLKIYARGRYSYQETCVIAVLHGQEPDGTPTVGIIALPDQPIDTLLWFKLK
jgi:hypothetical protein